MSKKWVLNSTPNPIIFGPCIYAQKEENNETRRTWECIGRKSYTYRELLAKNMFLTSQMQSCHSSARPHTRPKRICMCDFFCPIARARLSHVQIIFFPFLSFLKIVFINVVRFCKAKGIGFVANLSIYLCICQCGPVFAPLRFCSESH